MDKARKPALKLWPGRPRQRKRRSRPCAWPQRATHYVKEINRGSIKMRVWQQHLNEMYGRGLKIAQVFEQDGNTVRVYEHHFHP